jgi:hypothetical protein
MAELDKLGGPDIGDYGPLDDMDSTGDTLESAADDVTSALGDEQEQQPAGGAA